MPYYTWENPSHRYYVTAVYCDGEPVHNVTEWHTDEGWVRFYTGEDGAYEPVIGEKRGKITFKAKPGCELDVLTS